MAGKLVFIVFLLALVAGSGPVSAQTHMSGQLGADLGSYGFKNHIFDQDLKYYSDRRVANQFVDFNLQGPLVNGYLARYNTMMRLRATQIRSEVDGEVTTDMYDPEITHYFGALSLFPNRPFPVKIYTGKSEENSVRYEPAYRSEVETVDPGLAVVRRYATANKESGVLARWSIMYGLDVGLEVKQTANQLNRQYDFDENRNIWVDFTTISPGVAPYYNVEVVNTIPDRDVLLYVDFAFADTVKAGGTLDLVIEEGVRDIDFVPVGLNSFSQRLDMTSDMQWKIFFSDPPGSKDMDQQNDIVTGKLKYDRNGAFKTAAFIELNDGTEEVQEMVTNLQVFNNQATYDFSRNANLSSLTTFSSNLTDVGVISHQLSKMFMQQTTGKWSRNRGLSTMVSHSYSKMSSDTGTNDIKSTNNILTGNFLLPTNWKRHEVGLRLLGNFLSDSKNYSNNMLSAELGNKLEFKVGKSRWRPKHTFKVTDGQSKNPDGTNGELDSKLALVGEHPNLWVLGNVRLKGQYDWRQKESEKGFDIKNRYMVNFGLIKKFSPNYKLTLSGGLDKETFKFIAAEVGEDVPQRIPELRKTFRVDLQTVPLEGFNIGGNAMLISTNTSRITKYSASLRMVIPILEIPLRSYIIKEYREMEGLRPQELLQMETKLSYNFRKIKLVMSHRLTDETLITENYVYSEFIGKITRNFDVF